MEGGWQNNRVREPHEEYRMAENVLEELDAPGEWYFEQDEQWLYYYPAEEINMGAGPVVEAVFELPHLIEICGDTQSPTPKMTIKEPGNGMDEITIETPVTKKPVHNIHIKGIRFTGTARTFMETKEPLLRSDWTIYRGGAVHLRGTEDISITGCHFDQVGGNGVFVDGYNRRTLIKTCLFDRNGASGINFVGSRAAVRDPIFNYIQPPPPLETIDTEKGPKTDEYPADCVVEDCLMSYCGRVEKQPAGVNIAMASRITVRHNTIHHTPRAGINICTGTWGGHIIEWNECFDTVLETHDHGTFNSWGRDRFWFRATPRGPRDGDAMKKYLEKHPDIMLWDAYQTVILRNNRMQCDHGWSIDLDDGSTNYEIYNNICINGGLKNREGYYRKVYSNIILRGPFTCNVPYPKPTFDVFERNILVGGNYRSSVPELWGGVRDYNLFHNPGYDKPKPATAIQAVTLDDAHSIVADARFVDPENGDFPVKEDSPALELGFRNFPMTGFGVSSSHLKELAPEPAITMPGRFYDNKGRISRNAVFMGAEVDDLNTDDEITAYGAPSKSGVILVDVPPGSAMGEFGFENDDVILEINGRKVPNQRTLRGLLRGKGDYKVLIVRDQKEQTIQTPKSKVIVRDDYLETKWGDWKQLDVLQDG